LCEAGEVAPLYKCLYNRLMKKTSKQTNKNDLEFVESCGNVFKDLGFSDDEAANLLVRSDLMLLVKNIIRERGWTQQEAAVKLGVHQPRVSDLFQGRIGNFSVDTLMSWLHKLGKEVTISIKDKDVTSTQTQPSEFPL
jgi:predicted XRE-type DNA-binding protein